MKTFFIKVFFLIVLSTSVSVFTYQPVQAQCAMCTLSAESSVKNGNTQGLGLNDGILFLLAMPYLIVGVVGFIWYKKFRRKNTAPLQSKHESIHLN